MPWAVATSCQILLACLLLVVETTHSWTGVLTRLKASFARSEAACPAADGAAPACTLELLVRAFLELGLAHSAEQGSVSQSLTVRQPSVLTALTVVQQLSQKLDLKNLSLKLGLLSLPELPCAWLMLF